MEKSSLGRGSSQEIILHGPDGLKLKAEHVIDGSASYLSFGPGSVSVSSPLAAAQILHLISCPGKPLELVEWKSPPARPIAGVRVLGMLKNGSQSILTVNVVDETGEVEWSKDESGDSLCEEDILAWAVFRGATAQR